MSFVGKRIAVAGMGRSGISIALAAKRLGATPIVYDERSADTPAQLEALEKLESAEIETNTGWHGHLAGENFDLLVPSPGFRREHPAIRDALAADKPVISEIEFAYQISLAPIIAITGTNGKSTTTVMTWLALREAGIDAVLCGNIAGTGYPELTLTEAADRSTSDQVLVAEISSYQLEWVHEFRPRVAAITNITPDHFDRHPSFQDYFDTKLRIFARMGEGDVAVVNALEETVMLDVVQSAVQPGCSICPFPIGCGASITEKELCLGSDRISLDALPFTGSHNYVNAMMALSLAEAFIPAISHAEYLQGLTRFKPLEHRMEVLGSKNGVQIVNNSMCTNPGAVVASSLSLDHPQILLMGGEMKGLDFKPVGDYLRVASHRAVLFGPYRSKLADQLGVRCQEGESLEEAFQIAIKEARAGDVVMLAPGCASASPYANFRERGEAFRSIAMEWLNQNE
ncbi:MAG: UDP-N-acetylmuramoyl-L-alanine--D-glutamate ligase [Armatimonadetes bacterium]|nr:UDP-N-acetylmuramoyl-L-alanine--D-glutamate ligase [Armatimonadota bacterium]